MKYLKSVCARQDSLARIRVRQHHLAGHIHSFSSWSFLFTLPTRKKHPGRGSETSDTVANNAPATGVFITTPRTAQPRQT